MIKSLRAREILNSRGNYTIEVELLTNKGAFKASVPSGVSTGKYEAKLVDVKKALKSVKIIEKAIIGLNEKKQKKIDDILIKLDGTEDKSKLGSNAILATSIALARAGADKKPLYRYIRKIFRKRVKGWKMPKPCFNVINGGAHAGNKIDIQEFMIIPQESTFKSNLKTGAEFYSKLKKIIKRKYGKQSTNLGDEGGFAPNIADSLEVLDLLKNLLKGLPAGRQRKNIKIGLDVAASEFFKDGRYKFEGKSLTGEKLLEFYTTLIKKYPITFIEDPYEQDDYDSFEEITRVLGNKVTIVGDDLLVTNPDRIRIAYHEESCNGMIIKPNQIGTVTETLEAIKLAKQYKWKIIISHRSGETLDHFIADLAVGVGADYIKSGAPARGERLAKYNRLLEIESEIGI